MARYRTLRLAMLFGFFLAGAVGSTGEVRSITDFGGQADGRTDNGPALAKALAYAAAHPGLTLKLGGVCRVRTAQGEAGPFKVAAVGNGITDLTIEDGEILLGGRFSAFCFRHCPGLTLRNVAFDYDPPILSQGTIVATDQAQMSFTVVPDPGYPPPCGEAFANREGTWLTVHKPGGEYAFFFVGYIDQAREQDGKVTLFQKRADLAAAIEGVPGLRYVRVQRSYGHLLQMEFCDGLRLEGCSIYGTSAFAGLFVYCNDVTLVNNRICPRPGSDRMVSTCADGFHFIGAQRGPRIEHNFFDRLQDDNLVISLRGNRIKSAQGTRLELMPANPVWYRTGDVLEVIDANTGVRREYTIRQMDPQVQAWAPPPLTLDRPLEGAVVTADAAGGEQLPTVVFNKSWRLEGTVIRDNRFQNTRRYAVFMGAGRTRIERNVMTNHTSAALLLSSLDRMKAEKSQLLYYFSDQVEVSGNLITNALNYGEGGRNFALNPQGAIILTDLSPEQSGLGAQPLVRNIVIRNNRIVDAGTAGIYLANVDGVTLSDNVIENPNQHLEKDRYGIVVKAARNVNLNGNQVAGERLEAPVKIDAAEPTRADFRVVQQAGGPQLQLNGQAVTPYIFYGNPQTPGVAKVGREWQDVTYGFVAPSADDEAAVHFRIGSQAGEFWIAQVSVKDLTTGEPVADCRFDGGPDAWKSQLDYWCQGKGQNPPLSLACESGPGGGQLHVRLTAEDAKLDGFHLYLPKLKLTAKHSYEVAIRLRAEPERYFSSAVRHQGGDFRLYGYQEPNFISEARLAAGQGVKLLTFPVRAPWPRPEGEPDFSAVDQACQTALAAVPDAYLIPRVDLTPPAEWLQAHPELLMGYEDQKRGPALALTSELYGREAREALQGLIRHCEAAFGPRLAGYHPAGGNSNEWFYPQTWGKPLSGYDPATLAAWRKWLRTKYPTDEALQKAWGAAGISLAAAEVPAPTQRRGEAGQGLLAPAEAQPALDFNRFLQEAMSDLVLELARAAREAAGPGRLNLFFYGYVFEFSRAYSGPAVAGHYAVRRLLDSPDIDVLCAPISYQDRGLGGGAAAMTAAESVTLAGKFWLNENDTSTHIAHALGHHAPGWDNGATTLEESLELLRRDLAVAGCRNFATWWMDLPGLGWFDEPRLWAQMAFCRDFNRAWLASAPAFRPEIAAIVDERSLLYVGGTNVAAISSGSLVSEGRKMLNRVGAPYGQYLLDDFLAGRFDAKLRAFLAAYALTGEERRQLRACTRTGATLWGWAPGYVDLDTGKYSLAAVEELTGFAVRLMPTDTKAVGQATEAGRALGLPDKFGLDAQLTPLLSPPPAAGDTVLAVYAGGEPAVVLRKTAEAAEIFCSLTAVPTALYRHLARLGGVHLYAETDANVYARGNFVAVHAAESGKLALDLGRPGRIWSEFEQKYLGAGPRLELELRKGQTRLLRIDEAGQ